MKEAQIILGAAVIDDVLGLIVLAVVSGIVSAAEFGQPLALGAVIRLVLVALLFLGGTLIAGSFLVPRIMKQLSRLRTSGMMLISALVFCFALAYLADLTGLAPIVGAFAAGLLLEAVHFRGFNEDIQIEELIKPVSTFLVPIFFVVMGIQVRLESFANIPVLGLAAALTVAAIAGKQVCGFGVLEKNLDRLSIGVGMIPRGEVGLIFASIGKNLKVVDDSTFSAIVIMIIVTTLITPPILKLTLARKQNRNGGAHTRTHTVVPEDQPVQKWWKLRETRSFSTLWSRSRAFTSFGGSCKPISAASQRQTLDSKGGPFDEYLSRLMVSWTSTHCGWRRWSRSSRASASTSLPRRRPRPRPSTSSMRSGRLPSRGSR